MAENNLLGKSHKQYVQDQIKVRQEILGKSTRDSKELSWMNGKTSWVRLASSIDIENTFTETTQEKAINTGLADNPTSTTVVVNKKFDEIKGTKVGEYRVKEILDLNLSYMGSVLAQHLVLHGGTEIHSLNPDALLKRQGINIIHENSAKSISAYSSKNGDFGLVAMPGIESVDIKSKSMGSLREASISLRISDAEQLELIETLYLRIGYSVFLEWGNSSYYKYDNSGEGNHQYVKGPDAEPGLLFDFLNPPEELKKCPTNFIPRIENERKKSEGNYDALFGRVKNFSWQFNPQGYYEATLEVISWGDIIESLRIDGYYPNIALTKLKEFEDTTEETPQGSSIEKKDESLLNGYIYEATLPTGEIIIEESTYVSYQSSTKSYTEKRIFEPVKKTLKGDTSKEVKKTYANTGATSKKGSSSETLSEESDYSFALKYDRGANKDLLGKVISGIAVLGDQKTCYYVRFGDLLDFISSRLLLYVEDCDTPIVGINTDTYSNYCYNPLVNVSADPTKVMINTVIPASRESLKLHNNYLERNFVERNAEREDSEIRTFVFGNSNFRGKDCRLEPFTYDTILSEEGKIENVSVGLIMNIYFEKTFLYDTIDQHRDEKTGKLSLYNFIKSLLDEANNCLGGVNKLDLRVKNDQTLEIYDQVPLYEWKKDQSLPQEFNIFGLEPKTETNSNTGQKRVWNDGSFVTNFGLKTELTNEFATITSIGAQANGSVVGEDATFLSKWNFGLVDRFYPKKLDSYRKQTPRETTNKEEVDALYGKMIELWSDYSLQSVYLSNSSQANLVNIYSDAYAFPYFRVDNAQAYVKIQKDFLRALMTFKSKKQEVLSNQMGMLPINLNLEMDGISGIRIYDQIRVNTRFLPSYYPKYLIFIIKGLSHSFNGNRWITKIDTIAQPKVQFDKAVDLTWSDNLTIGDELRKLISKGLGGENSTEDKEIPFDGSLETWFPVEEPVKYRTSDSFGSGEFGAGRGNRLHYGVDLAVSPGQQIYAPFKGRIRIINSIYADGSHPELKGIEVSGTGDYLGWHAQLLYVTLNSPYYDGFITKGGKPIGTAQNMASSYGEGMTNHVHYAIYKKVDGVKKYVDVENWLKSYYSTPITESTPQTSSPSSPQPDSNNESSNTETNNSTSSKEAEENNADGYEDLSNADVGNTVIIEDPPIYQINGELVTKEEFINKVNQTSKEELQTNVWNVSNDDSTLQILLDKFNSQ